MFFSNPVCLVLLVVVIPILTFGNLRRSSLVHTKVSLHKNLRATPLVARIPSAALVFAWTFMVLALSRPVLIEAHNTATIESRDIVISLDVSSSMDAAVPFPTAREQLCEQPQDLLVAQTGSNEPPPDGEVLPARTYSRLDAARDAALMFVACRDGDRVGYQPFAERAFTGWPLTADLQIVYTMISLAGEYTGSSTNFDGPTGSSGKIGALQAAINHFNEIGHAETRVLVMVTDGEDTIVTARYNELLEQMREMNIRIYVLGVGNGWTQNSTQDLRRFVEALGGVVIPVTDADQMRAAFERIDQLEKSEVVIETAVTYREVYDWFLLACAIAFLAWLLSSALVYEDM